MFKSEKPAPIADRPQVENLPLADWELLKSLVADAAESTDRDALLHAMPDAALRRYAEVLLSAHDDAGSSFLEPVIAPGALANTLRRARFGEDFCSCRHSDGISVDGRLSRVCTIVE